MCFCVCGYLSVDAYLPLSSTHIHTHTQTHTQCAVKYSKERKAFGSPISKLYAIQLKLSQMASSLGMRMCVCVCVHVYTYMCLYV